MPINAGNYDWLDTIGRLPRMVAEARALVGTKEGAKTEDNPEILEWAKVVGIEAGPYTADSIPWCGLFMAYVARRAGKTPPEKPYWALNWGKFGTDSGQPELGDVLTFIRITEDGKKAGHVALYIGQDDSHCHVLGGNQADMVCYERKPLDSIVAARRPPYMTVPGTARVFLLDAQGRRRPD